ncbi:MAG: IS256 family transposase [Anaerovoracaceae bacterium]|jgi:putative transposase
MAYTQNNTNLSSLLFSFMNQPDPMLSMLEWLCEQMMEAEVSAQLNAAKSEQSDDRSGYRSGYRPRRLDTRLGTIYLMVPKVRKGGYIPFFVNAYKRSEAALVQVVQEAYINGVSTRKIERLAKKLGIENISRSQVSEMTRGLNEQVDAFRNRSLEGKKYPILWTDALYEDVRIDGRVISEAIIVVCGVDETGKRDILSVDPMADESCDAYKCVFNGLKDRGLVTPKLIISDANKGLVTAIKQSFPGASWQRCKVHFMRNILAHIPQRQKKTIAAELKMIWLAPNADIARERAEILIKKYGSRYSEAIRCLEDGLEDSLTFFSFPEMDHRKISSSNMIERLNREIRRRTNVIGIFPNESSYVRLITTYLMEYAEEWSTSTSYIRKEAVASLLNEEVA